MRERCGECRLCLDRLSDARVRRAARVLDARRCIAYLTIEHRGAIDEVLRPQVGDWLFGCDACQDVCPLNRAAPDEPVTARVRRGGRARVAELEPESCCSSTRAPSSSSRTARRCAARGAKGWRATRPSCSAMRARRALPVLRASASDDPSEVVRDAAHWAIDARRRKSRAWKSRAQLARSYAGAPSCQCGRERAGASAPPPRAQRARACPR